jgi:hypothetical protein
MRCDACDGKGFECIHRHGKGNGYSGVILSSPLSDHLPLAGTHSAGLHVIAGWPSEEAIRSYDESTEDQRGSEMRGSACAG